MHAQTESKFANSLRIWSARFRHGEPVERDHGQQGFGFGTEWVIPDGLGGFAMGSISGLPMRRYHGLLCSSLTPPVRRTMMLSALDEYIHIPRGGTCGTDLDIRLTGFQFADQEPPIESPYLSEFAKDSDSCSWTYSIPTQLGPVHIRKTLTIADRIGGCRIEYEIEPSLSIEEGSEQQITIEIRPLVSMRDFHELNEPGSVAIEDFTLDPIIEPAVAGVAVSRAGLSKAISIRGVQLDWNESPTLWRGVTYHCDALRGQDSAEDLFGPGVFAAKLSANTPHALSIEATIDNEPTLDWVERSANKESRIRSSIDQALQSAGNPEEPSLREAIAQLAQAADDFIVRRDHGGVGSSVSTSLLAGYPWFSDWGRDTMIALPGVFLDTGRFDEAHQTLTTFANAIEHGLIPNRFDDGGGSSHYNTVDASLWFVHACLQWARATGKDLDQDLINACDEIIDSYIAGTINGIGLDDEDGLIFAGDANTQLTWMDALRDGVVFTPRHGKAIEINALWINALEARLRMGGARVELEKRASQARQSIVNRMAQGPSGGLVDCITREHGVRTSRWISSPELRPNQCFALSLPFVNLPDSIAKDSLNAVTDALLTPVGLRTLDPQDPGYCPHYAGSMTDRDRAYHNGTVWPWLLGPYCEALLRVNSFDTPSRKQAQAIMLGLVSKMELDAVGQLFEIYDAEPTEGSHRPQGCMAQAWSISEALRVLVLSCQGQ